MPRWDYQALAAFETRVRHLYTVEKLSTYQIAALLGCCQGKVGRALKRAGVRRRTQGQGVRNYYKQPRPRPSVHP